MALVRPTTQAEPEQEPNTAGSDQNPELDLCFLCDCTASMGEYISAAQDNIRQIVDRVASSEKADVRFALICYRDHPPEDDTYVTRVFPFTQAVAKMQSYVASMAPEGGGDGPEAVTAALHDTLEMPWRIGATKIAVLIADAPPHGLEPEDDGFPDGDPQGRDPLEIARQMASQSITCYTVGCEPALGAYLFARDFMCTLAETTGGQAIALSSASLLADVIINGSAEEISLTRLQREVDSELDHVLRLAQAQAESIDDAECARRAWTNLNSRNVVSKQMRCDGGMKNAHHGIWHKPGSGPRTLASTKAELCAMEGVAHAHSGGAGHSRVSWRGMGRGIGAGSSRRCRGPRSSEDDAEEESGSASPTSWFGRRGLDLESSAHASNAATTNVLTEDVISMDQVSRLMMRKCHRG